MGFNPWNRDLLSGSPEGGDTKRPAASDGSTRKLPRQRPATPQRTWPKNPAIQSAKSAFKMQRNAAAKQPGANSNRRSFPFYSQIQYAALQKREKRDTIVATGGAARRTGS